MATIDPISFTLSLEKSRKPIQRDRSSLMLVSII